MGQLCGASLVAVLAIVGCRTGFPSANMDRGDTGMDAAGIDTGMDSRVVDSGPDVPPCVATVETCNGMNDDCDELVDEGFDTSTDRANCGSCGNFCSDVAFGVPTCVAGECGFACEDGFEDCNGSPSDGCEAILSTPATCGDCSTTCTGPTGLCETEPTPTCVSSCATTLTLCGDSCVNLATDGANCGSCGLVCPPRESASVSCVGGVCVTTCLDEFLDCDSVEGTGCETTGVLTFVDGDGDGVGAGPPMLLCPDPGLGFSALDGDCDDADSRVFPGQTLYFTTPRSDATFDYDCNGGSQAEFRLEFLCASGDPCFIGTIGWQPPIPTCGEAGVLVTNCVGSFDCSLLSSARIQGCR
jgi:hypothetical protein